jgi:hypothetical protein
MKIIIEDISDIASMMKEAIDEGKNKVAFIGLYFDSISLIKELCMFDEIDIEQINIEPQGYEKEWVIILDSNYNIKCRKLYIDEKYKSFNSDIVFIADDCDKGCLEGNIKEIYQVGYNFDNEECDGNCEYCNIGVNDFNEAITRIGRDDEGKIRGFEKSWESYDDGLHYHSTYSFYSDDEDMLKEMLKNFNNNY